MKSLYKESIYGTFTCLITTLDKSLSFFFFEVVLHWEAEFFCYAISSSVYIKILDFLVCKIKILVWVSGFKSHSQQSKWQKSLHIYTFVSGLDELCETIWKKNWHHKWDSFQLWNEYTFATELKLTQTSLVCAQNLSHSVI